MPFNQADLNNLSPIIFLIHSGTSNIPPNGVETNLI